MVRSTEFELTGLIVLSTDDTYALGRTFEGKGSEVDHFVQPVLSPREKQKRILDRYERLSKLPDPLHEELFVFTSGYPQSLFHLLCRAIEQELHQTQSEPQEVSELQSLIHQWISHVSNDQLSIFGDETLILTLKYSLHRLAASKDSVIQQCLLVTPRDQFAIALIDLEEETKERLLSNVSQRARKNIEDALSFLGHVDRTDIRAARLAMARQMLELEAWGKIVLEG
jgi:hypothetical protein